jgi:N6-L-threonylcarbamoyladenine synthase
MTGAGIRSVRVLGIETSCDETAAAVVSRRPDGTPQILSNIVLSQIGEHAAFGGVVPEIAARAHVEALDGIIEAALEDAATGFDALDAIAVSTGPGLMGGLIAGLMTAKAIAAATGKPLLAINHLEAHVLTARLTERLEYPYLVLLVSGGHTQLICVNGLADYRRWGTTIDDAVGEAFDKTAKLLGLAYPGGPAVEQAALSGDPDRFDLPRPLRGQDRLDFSFSGLKTAVRQTAVSLAPLSGADVADICASFQAAVAATLVDRTGRALERFRRSFPDLAEPVLVAAGGVASNRLIRAELTGCCAKYGVRFVAPPLELCTDNAAMIAWSGLERFEAGLVEDDVMAAAPRARWPLDPNGNPATGLGKRGAKA